MTGCDAEKHNKASGIAGGITSLINSSSPDFSCVTLFQYFSPEMSMLQRNILTAGLGAPD